MVNSADVYGRFLAFKSRPSSFDWHVAKPIREHYGQEQSNHHWVCSCAQVSDVTVIYCVDYIYIFLNITLLRFISFLNILNTPVVGNLANNVSERVLYFRVNGHFLMCLWIWVLYVQNMWMIIDIEKIRWVLKKVTFLDREARSIRTRLPLKTTSTDRLYN